MASRVALKERGLARWWRWLRTTQRLCKLPTPTRCVNTHDSQSLASPSTKSFTKNSESDTSLPAFVWCVFSLGVMLRTLALAALFLAPSANGFLPHRLGLHQRQVAAAPIAQRRIPRHPKRCWASDDCFGESPRSGGRAPRQLPSRTTKTTVMMAACAHGRPFQPPGYWTHRCNPALTNRRLPQRANGAPAPCPPGRRRGWWWR